MTNLQTFKNSEFGAVRTITKDGEPWFVGKDVATVLQYANTSKAINDHVDSDDLTNRYPIVDSMGRTQEVSLINESGLYSLIFSSKLPKATEFKRWVTSEVLPSIRGTGTYSAKPMTQIQMLAAQAQAMADLERKTEVVITAVETVQRQLSGALGALAAPVGKDWQTETVGKIRRICLENQLSYITVFSDLYKELESTAHIDLQRRVDFLRKRMRQTGATAKETNKISKLYIISANPVIQAAFDGIVRRVDARYTTGRLPL